MAQTQHPDDDGAWATGPGGGAPRMPEPGGDAATSALPPYGAPQTPGRGTAAPLGTVGDGRYRLTHRLGRGGMAEVLAAQDVRLGRTVAVKLLRGELAQDEIARLRFTREAHAVAALNHHAIVAVYDTGEEYVGEESTPYIVMELVEGRTVRELLVDEEEPPVDQALIIIAGVLEALAYSHRHGIVHRDIKPANVIITTTGAVKVMDFGIARALTGTASTMTQTGMVMGTPQYLSPEQALGKPVDHRSDLYAAGCMLYELLALRPPFTGDTPLSVVYQHVQDMPVPPSQANPRVPAAWTTWCCARSRRTRTTASRTRTSSARTSSTRCASSPVAPAAGRSARRPGWPRPARATAGCPRWAWTRRRCSGRVPWATRRRCCRTRCRAVRTRRPPPTRPTAAATVRTTGTAADTGAVATVGAVRGAGWPASWRWPSRPVWASPWR